MKKKVFIIGNGFDIDLGWKTRYSDFVYSDFCPIIRGEASCPMEEYLAERIAIERWYDLEVLLKEYASTSFNTNESLNEKDEAFFNNLKDSLTCYIRNEEQKRVDGDSLAAHVLKAVIENGFFSSIFTFNYTNLSSIARNLKIVSRFDYQSVHGCAENSSIILGVDDHCELRDGYSYLRKVFSEHYSSHHIRYDLQECDEVAFFGHSLGDMDYPYFLDFFNAQSHCSNRKDGKRITIFTKDNSSRIQILEQLRKMNAGQTEHLQNDNDLTFVMTDNPNQTKLKQFFDHLKKDSKRTVYHDVSFY